MNKALIVLPLGLALVGVAVWLRSRPAEVPRTLKPAEKPAPEEKPAPPVATETPKPPPADTRPAPIDAIRTEAGAALNVVRMAQRQLEVFGRISSVKTETVTERMKDLRTQFANLRLASAIDRLDGPGHPESVRLAIELLTRLRSETEKALQAAATVRGKTELGDVESLANVERDLVALVETVSRGIDKLK